MTTATEYADAIAMAAMTSDNAIRDMVRLAMLEGYKLACEDAAVRCGAIGPCSGTRDWNESRWKAMKDCSEAVLALLDSKTPESFL